MTTDYRFKIMPTLTSPPLPIIAEKHLRRRDRAEAWIRRRGVDIGEIISVGASFIYAWRAVDVRGGIPVAPLTSKLFNLDGGFWFWLLVLNGFAVLSALLLGWLTGNTYRIRSYVSLASSCVWLMIAFAAHEADFPPSVSVGYAFTCAISWFTALILILRAKYAEVQSQLPPGAARAEGEF